MSARAPRRGFVWALAASILLHGVLLALTPAHRVSPLPAADPLPAIEVQLTPAPSTATPVTVVAPRTARPVATRPPPRPAPPVEPPPATFTEPPPVAAVAAAQTPPPADAPPADAPPADAPPADAPPADAPPADAPPADGPPAGILPADPPPAGTAPLAGSAGGTAPDAAAAGGDTPATTAGAEPAPAPTATPGSVTFPRSGRLEYAVTVGEPPTPVGRAIYTWEASETTYRLTLVAQTTGLAGLLRRVRVEQSSHGRITAAGLQPEAYAMDRGPNARNEFARFDWAARQLTFGYLDAIQTGALADGAQDPLSLILQFAFVPIVDGRREVLFTTGRRLYVQSYERVGEEVVETAGGAWRAWHLRRVRAKPTDEGYDMWLAIDRPYLPVRIRWTDRGGRTLSATVDTLRLARD